MQAEAALGRTGLWFAVLIMSMLVVMRRRRTAALPPMR